MGEQQKMTIEEAIAILDPETSRAALFGYRYFGGFRGSEAVLAATEEVFPRGCPCHAGIPRKERR